MPRNALDRDEKVWSEFSRCVDYQSWKDALKTIHYYGFQVSRIVRLLVVFHIVSVELRPFLVCDGETLECDVLELQDRKCESLPLSCVTVDSVPYIAILDLGVGELRIVRA